MKSVPSKERFFDDFSVGEMFTFGDYLVEEYEILEFATRYDPQPFHVDAAVAAASAFGGLIASGWHTCAAGFTEKYHRETAFVGDALHVFDFFLINERA